jgi:4-carboxymuconolactone decarboxylase
MLVLLSFQGRAQSNYVRIANIVVDSSRLTDYITALREGIETAVYTEPGVLAMYAVAEKNLPHHITIMETYASRAAYEQHLQTPHFQKYKRGTLSWVTSLVLTEVVPVISKSKQ